MEKDFRDFSTMKIKYISYRLPIQVQSEGKDKTIGHVNSPPPVRTSFLAYSKVLVIHFIFGVVVHAFLEDVFSHCVGFSTGALGDGTR